ncbi:hypothetical protein UFOVP653_14 [uncultured Caudovirales phage]|uniref:PD-(D/E)XK nuclease superfamily n=1 Tax=uncultured Caudovirales phage TaxID=2100421 RepID=A0A6J5NGT5_9CAUD|nr:hypothetical protein UFOVP653_14 [uncultured Caudovirales phage]
MADLSEFVQNPLVTAIYEAYEKRYGAELSRTYLGASIIGKDCARALWYDFRWASKPAFDGRMYRLFQTGHLEEPRFVSDLRAVGVEVYDVDPATGKQFGFQGHGGHMRGHMDGCARYVPDGGRKWHVVEFKTHSEKSFKELTKKGVQESKPQHYAQMQWYMGKSGMERGLYLAKNKNSDELYAERIRFDRVYYERLQAKAAVVIFSGSPPDRISEDPKFFLCNWCDHKAVCHGHKAPALSCRTCVHATPEEHGDGRWSCAKDSDRNVSSIPVQVQRTGCGDHLPLPFLLTYAEAMDAGEGWIEFKRRDNGETFMVLTKDAAYPSHKPAGYAYRSAEISAAADHRAICNPEVEIFRTTFDGTIVA